MSNFIIKEIDKLNLCRCGSDKKPKLDLVIDSESHKRTWSVNCNDCKQSYQEIDSNIESITNKWNQENSLEAIRDFKLNSLLK